MNQSQPTPSPLHSHPTSRELAGQLVADGVKARVSQLTAHIERLQSKPHYSEDSIRFFSELVKSDQGCIAPWVRSATRITVDLFSADPSQAEWKALPGLLRAHTYSRSQFDRREAEAAAQALRAVAALDHSIFNKIIERLNSNSELNASLSQTICLLGLTAAVKERLTDQQINSIFDAALSPSHNDSLYQHCDKTITLTLQSAGLSASYIDGFVPYVMDWFLEDGFERRRCELLTLVRSTVELNRVTTKAANPEETQDCDRTLGTIAAKLTANSKHLAPILANDIRERLESAEPIAPFLEHLLKSFETSAAEYLKFRASLRPDDPRIEKYAPDMIAHYEDERIRTISDALARGTTSGMLPNLVYSFEKAMAEHTAQLIAAGTIGSAVEIIDQLALARRIFIELSDEPDIQTASDTWISSIVALINQPDDSRLKVLRRGINACPASERLSAALSLTQELKKIGPLNEIECRRAYSLIQLCAEANLVPELVDRDLLTRTPSATFDTHFTALLGDAQAADNEGLPELAAIKRDTIHAAMGLPGEWQNLKLLEPGLRALESIFTSIVTAHSEDLQGARTEAREMLRRFFSFGSDFALLELAAKQSEADPINTIKNLKIMASHAAVRRMAIGSEELEQRGLVTAAGDTLSQVFNTGGLTRTPRTRSNFDLINPFQASDRLRLVDSFVDLSRGMHSLSSDLAVSPKSKVSIMRRFADEVAHVVDTVALDSAGSHALSISDIRLDRLGLNVDRNSVRILDEYGWAIGHRAISDLESCRIIADTGRLIITGPHNAELAFDGVHLSLVITDAAETPMPAVLVPTSIINERIQHGLSLAPEQLAQAAISRQTPFVSLLEPNIVGGFLYGLPPELSPLERYLGATQMKDLAGRPHIVMSVDGEVALQTQIKQQLSALRAFELTLHGIVDRYAGMMQSFRMAALGGWHRGDTEAEDSHQIVRIGKERHRMSRARMLLLAEEWLDHASFSDPQAVRLLAIGQSSEYRRRLKPRAYLDLAERRLYVPGKSLNLGSGALSSQKNLEKWFKFAAPLFSNDNQERRGIAVMSADLRFMRNRDIIGA